MQPILVIYTGGTIGMEKYNDGTYRPTYGFKRLAKKAITKPIWKQMPCHEYLEISPVIDSSDVTPKDWQNIAKTIISNYNNYRGFVILHGTDTMAYTASILSFMLGAIDKTIILTGSQIPLIEPYSDGINNLLVSLQIVNSNNVPEVCIYFANKLFRGNRASKISTSAMIAFESANYPKLACFENKIKFFSLNCLPSKPPCFQNISLPEINAGDVAIMYFIPGMSMEVMKMIINSSTKGIVLVSYGSGNTPINSLELNKNLKYANKRNIIMINVSQCAGGHVNLNYAASKLLLKYGVVSGEDMTIEAAVTKLYYLLAKYKNNIDVIKEKLSENLRGELTKE